jgi:IS5 family transposase
MIYGVKQTDLGFALSSRRTRKMELLELMNSVVPRFKLLSQLTAVALPKVTGRLHLLQQLFDLSDFGMEEAMFKTLLYRDFAGLAAHARLPDRVSILRLRHLLRKHNLA